MYDSIIIDQKASQPARWRKLLLLMAQYVALTQNIAPWENQMNKEQRDFFKEVTLRICGDLDIDKALHETFEYLEQLLPIDAAALVYTDEKQMSMFPIAVIQRKGIDFYEYKGSMNLSVIPLYDNYARDRNELETEMGSVLILNRPESWRKEMLDRFPNVVKCSSLNLQLKIRGERIGVFIVSAEGQDRYSEADAALLATVREPIAVALSNVRCYRDLKKLKDLLAEDNKALSADIKRAVGVEVVGADFGLKEVMQQAQQIAQSNSPALLLGETGTGKEVIANAIHLTSPRRKRPMIFMQCGAIPVSLLDSGLFGHEKGAFTGATERKRGRFERADGGTLFLDEIGELSQEAQVKLLRVLQENKFERIGGALTIEVDVRVIAATHRDLEAMVRKGKFREDLWYRLNVLPIRIPPLRLRREDIPSLVQYFVEKKANEMNLSKIPRIDSASLNRLKRYDWPGNVRELQNIVERALILSRGDYLDFPDLSNKPILYENQQPDDSSGSLITMDQAMANHINYVLEKSDGQIAGKGGAAEILNMNPSTLRFRMKQLGIRYK